MRHLASTARRTIVVSVVVIAAACGGSDDDADQDAAESTPDTTAAPTTQPNTTPTTQPTTTPSTTGAASVAPATTTPATPVPTRANTEAPTTTTATTGTGAAVVEVGEQRYEFLVIQCLRDQPSVVGDQIIELTLDGVPPDTPADALDPLMGAMEPGADVMGLIEPVLEYGPALSVSRFEDGGDYVVLYDFDTIEFLSDPEPLSPDARFLDIPDGDAGITITGSTTTGGQPLTLTATCP